MVAIRGFLHMHYRWLYTLFISLDANFRMQRKAVSNDAVDPGLNKGYSYIVEEKAYKEWLSTATPYPEVCTIIISISFDT